jgi:O-antigen/teichoic acid export membrane protein
MLKKLFSHTAIYGLAPQITKVASFFSLPFITAELTELDYGVAGVLGAYTSAISVLSTLGLRVVLVNSFFKSTSQYKWAWRQIYGFLTLWNFVYATLIGLLIYNVIPEAAQSNALVILLLNITPLVFFGQTSAICSTYYQLNQQPTQIAIRSIIFGFLSIGLNVYFIAYLKMGYMGWFWTTFIVGILTNISYFYPLNFRLKLTPIFNFKRRSIKKSLKVGLPMIPHFYSTYLLNSSDKMVMDLMKVSTAEVGKYNVAYTVANFVSSLGNASGRAVGPLLNVYYKARKDERARDLIFVLQICFLSITFVLSIWLKEIFFLLIKNEKLAEMYYLGIPLIMAYCYRPMYFGSNAKLIFAEKTNVLWKVTLVAGVLNVLLNIVLIPVFGFEIAALTTFVGYLYMGYAGYYFKVFKEINSVNYYPLLWMLLTIAIAGAAYYIVELSWIYKAILTGVSAIITLYTIWILNKKLNEV